MILLLIACVLFSAGMFSFYMVRAKPVFYGQPVYQGDSRYNEVALTFNVFWGEEYIPGILEILREKNVKATFFMGGTWVKKFPDLTRKISEEGHELGSHGYSHPHPDRLSKSANLKEMQKAEELIYQVTGQRPKLFAPPYGERGPAVLQAAGEAGYTTILWSVDTIDWERPSPGVILQRVLSKVENGSIILMHPTEPTLQALPEMLEGLKERGYSPVTVSRVLERLSTSEADNQKADKKQ